MLSPPYQASDSALFHLLSMSAHALQEKLRLCFTKSACRFAQDCHAIMGRLLDHDTGYNQSTLSDAFGRTQELWREQTGEAMVTHKPDRQLALL